MQSTHSNPPPVPTIASLIPSRQSDFWIETPDLLLDYSRQNLDEARLQSFQTQYSSKIFPKIQQMFVGEKINFTEKRAVLHYLNRWARDKPEFLIQKAKAFKQNLGLSEDISKLTEDLDAIYKVRAKVEDFVTRVRNADFKLASGEQVQDIVCVGIGGSYLGTKSVYEALKESPQYKTQAKARKLHFIANVDPMSVYKVMSAVDFRRTLVIVISKSFGTQETMQNMRLVLRWMLKLYQQAGAGLTREQVLNGHFAVITANDHRALETGIAEGNIFAMFSHTGGRFSVSSAVGVLPLGLVFGNAAVDDFLRGMHVADLNFFGLQEKSKESRALSNFRQINYDHPSFDKIPSIIQYSAYMILMY